MLIFILTITMVAAYFLARMTRPKAPTEKKVLPEPVIAITPDVKQTEIDFNQDTSLTDLGYDPAPVAAAPAEPKPKTTSPRDLFLIYLTAAADKPFQGYELVEALLAANLRHGTRDLFHYTDPHGNVLFSIAQATETGAFELEKMGGIACRGLVIFMQPDENTAEFALDRLLATAYQLADELGGRLEDTHRQPLTQQTINAYRNKCVPA